MSSSSLYAIDKGLFGERVEEFSNSWLFSPIIWDVLADKHIEESKKMNEYGFKRNVIGDHDLWREINDIMNHSDCLMDRICWEISNQQIFFTKNKDIIIGAIKDFLKYNSNFAEIDGERVLKIEHIKDRILEVCESIEKIREEEYPFFQFKNTSCDDSVERLFYNYEEDREASLKEEHESIHEFIILKDGSMTFIANTDYEKALYLV